MRDNVLTFRDTEVDRATVNPKPKGGVVSNTRGSRQKVETSSRVIHLSPRQTSNLGQLLATVLDAERVLKEARSRLDVYVHGLRDALDIPPDLKYMNLDSDTQSIHFTATPEPQHAPTS